MSRSVVFLVVTKLGESKGLKCATCVAEVLPFSPGIGGVCEARSLPDAEVRVACCFRCSGLRSMSHGMDRRSQSFGLKVSHKVRIVM